jgi:hypothetical protein
MKEDNMAKSQTLEVQQKEGAEIQGGKNCSGQILCSGGRYL